MPILRFVKKHLSKSSSCSFPSSGAVIDLNTTPDTMDSTTVTVLQPKLQRNSIAEKIAALKSNGESNWKKKVAKEQPPIINTKHIPFPPVLSSSGEEDQNEQQVELRKTNNKELSSVVASRKSLLEKSQDGWRTRVGTNDAKDLTVNEKLVKAGKLPYSSGIDLPKSSIVESGKLKGIKAVLPPIKFRPKNELTGAAVGNNRHTVCVTDSSPKSPTKQEEILNQENNLYKRSISSPQNQRSDNSSSAYDSDEDKVTRNVVKNDNETFTSFFSHPILSPTSSGSLVVIEESSFNSMQSSEHQMLGFRKNIRINRKHGNAVRNPIKSLANRLSHEEQSYTEIKPEILEKEIKKRSQIENRTSTK